MNEPTSSSDFAFMTVDIVSFYVINNRVGVCDLPALIQAVHKTLSSLNKVAAPTAEALSKVTPAQISKSITPEALISFEDGKPYKTLTRHLSARGLTVAEYKTKWELPPDYPSSASTSSARRSAMAKSLGLGRKAAASPNTAIAPRVKKTSKSSSTHGAISPAGSSRPTRRRTPRAK